MRSTGAWDCETDTMQISWGRGVSGYGGEEPGKGRWGE